MSAEKKTTAISSILVILTSIAVLHLVNLIHNELTIDLAMEPVKHLSDARHLIVNGDYKHAIQELDDAMMKMRVIEQYTDSSSIAFMEQAVEDLELVEKEMRMDNLEEDDLNRAFFNALNSIAYACMTISENNLDKGEKYRAMQFMNATFAEMIASLKFVEDEHLKHKEEKVIAHVREIIDKMESTKYTFKFDYDMVNHELEELIEK
ncbi:hypothetical protein SAMN04488029_1588 [Reichenbachiella faecimaris]|uniref:Uncharacterized protein n=1 Tax=Reichenbachiella faecimaris TaxID=692418 RepID=A0A1W2G982_REIFA|nr:hypothetical protein [Reichenbachiella faecimaris]SMD33250.1 hypothetical protein SAMN04488029_1588 [Reichenbachiella faecimaris]